MRIDLQSKELGSIRRRPCGLTRALVQGGMVLHHANMTDGVHGQGGGQWKDTICKMTTQHGMDQ